MRVIFQFLKKEKYETDQGSLIDITKWFKSFINDDIKAQFTCT